MEKCLDDKVYAAKVASQMKNGTDMFSVTWTPGNVLINTETLEYDVISWAFPTSAFVDLVERLK